jgi:hypothetical protein
VEISLLCGAKLSAVVDAVNRFGQGAFAGLHFVRGEELGDLFALPHCAKIAGGCDEFNA